MTEQSLPRVLVVSTNAWRDQTGVNTLIEFFRCWDPDRLAQIYTKSALPNTAVCHRFFQISENAVIKSVFRRGITTGKCVKNQLNGNSQEAVQEQKMYASYRGKIRAVLSLMRELVWKFGKWKTPALDAFVDEFDPDVIFCPIYPTVYMGRIQKYLVQKTGKPVVSYLADDNVTYRSVSKNPVSLLHRHILRKYIKFLVGNSKTLMVISPKQKEEYDRFFGVDSVVMTKGIDFEPFVPYTPSNPVKMVYTGKLIIGRWNSLAAIAQAMGKVNQTEQKVTLDIYTTDPLTRRQSRALNRYGCSVKGSLTLDEVKKVQRQADILVFVESLEKRYRQIARLSFSTKITDYLQSGKCIFAVGDPHIAPIDYFQRYHAAVTACSYDEIEERLTELIYNPSRITQIAQQGYQCGVDHHERNKMNQLLIRVLCEAAK